MDMVPSTTPPDSTPGVAPPQQIVFSTQQPPHLPRRRAAALLYWMPAVLAAVTIGLAGSRRRGLWAHCPATGSCLTAARGHQHCHSGWLDIAASSIGTTSGVVCCQPEDGLVRHDPCYPFINRLPIVWSPAGGWLLPLVGYAMNVGWQLASGQMQRTVEFGAGCRGPLRRAAGRRLCLYLSLFAVRLLVYIVLNRVRGQPAKCWYADLVECRHEFELSDHVFFIVMQYMIPLGFETVAVVGEACANATFLTGMFGAWLVLLLSTLLYTLYFTVVFFHTLPEAIGGFVLALPFVFGVSVLSTPSRWQHRIDARWFFSLASHDVAEGNLLSGSGDHGENDALPTDAAHGVDIELDTHRQDVRVGCSPTVIHNAPNGASPEQNPLMLRA